MLKLSIWEIFIGTIPEAVIFVFGVYILANIKFNLKKIFTTGISGGLLVYLIRLLPIYPGVNILIFIVIISIITAVLNNINFIKVIPYIIILSIIRIVTELVCIQVFTSVFKISMNSFTNDTLVRLIYGIPSLILFALIVYVVYKKNYNADKGVV